MQSPIVSAGIAGSIAALLITTWPLAAPIVTLARLGTRIVGPGSVGIYR
jgi:hypothetical protein